MSSYHWCIWQNLLPRFMLKRILVKGRRAVGQREFGKSVSVQLADKFKEAYWKLADMMAREVRQVCIGTAGRQVQRGVLEGRWYGKGGNCCNDNCWFFFVKIISIPDEEFIFWTVRRVHRFIICLNYMMFPLVLYPPFLRQCDAFICGRRRVAVARHRMICLVLIMKLCNIWEEVDGKIS